jgi:hypothetical protein
MSCYHHVSFAIVDAYRELPMMQYRLLHHNFIYTYEWKAVMQHILCMLQGPKLGTKYVTARALRYNTRIQVC